MPSEQAVVEQRRLEMGIVDGTSTEGNKIRPRAAWVHDKLARCCLQYLRHINMPGYSGGQDLSQYATSGWIKHARFAKDHWIPCADVVKELGHAAVFRVHAPSSRKEKKARTSTAVQAGQEDNTTTTGTGPLVVKLRISPIAFSELLTRLRIQHDKPDVSAGAELPRDLHGEASDRVPDGSDPAFFAPENSTSSQHTETTMVCALQDTLEGGLTDILETYLVTAPDEENLAIKNVKGFTLLNLACLLGEQSIVSRLLALPS